ncbi:hypothetical protein V8E36_009327 [Tilletia maclaganii]
MITPHWDKPVDLPPPPPQQLVLTEDVFRRLLDVRSEKKDDDPPGFALPSFKVGDSPSSGIHRLWHDCSALIPDDLIQLFSAGVHVPLSLFTLAAIRDFGIHQRRSTFTERMSAKMQEELNSWHQRDNYLPFAEWAQATFTSICLFRSIRVAPEGELPEEDPVHQLTEHAINIVARANSNNWPILREYNRRIRALVWSQAKKGAALPFNISTLNPELIDNVENYIGGKSGAIADAAAAPETGWAAVVQAPAAYIVRVGQRLNQALNPSRFQIAARDDPSPRAYTSVAAGKRKMDDDAFPAQGARPAPLQPSFRANSFAGQSSPSVQTQQPASPAHPRAQQQQKPPPSVGTPARLYVICRAFTNQHSSGNCPGPYPKGLGLGYYGGGFRLDGKSQNVCFRWNAGIPEPQGETCRNGHYCPQCGQDGCRSAYHGVRQEGETAIPPAVIPSGSAGASTASNRV